MLKKNSKSVKCFSIFLRNIKKSSVSISKFTIFFNCFVVSRFAYFLFIEKGKINNLLIFHFFFIFGFCCWWIFRDFSWKFSFVFLVFVYFFFNKIDDWGIFHLILRKFLWFSLFEGVFWWSTELFALFCFMVGCSLKTEKWN